MTLLGIPYHLLTYEVMESICNRSGIFKQMAQLGSSIGVHSGVRAMVSNCDVKLIPQFVSLVDLGGVVYPVRIILDVQDEFEEEESSSASHAILVWRCKGSKTKDSLNISRVVESFNNVHSFQQNSAEEAAGIIDKRGFAARIAALDDL